MPLNIKVLDGIVLFVEVSRAGSFTQAAINSEHSTSYISKEISKLENRLGVRLLNRTTRSLSLTPEGENYLQQAQQIVHDAEQAESAVTGRQQEPRGTLRIGCPVSFGLSRLRPVMAEFMEQYPLVNLELDLNNRKVDIIADGFDVLIRASGQLEDSGLISRRFMSSCGVTLASPSYLDKHGTPKHPSDLSGHQTISYSNLKQPGVWTYEDLDGKPCRVKINPRLITNNSEMELSLCLAGNGITRLPKFHLSDELIQGTLVELFADYPKPDIDIYLIYPSRKHMSSKLRCFVDFIVQRFGEVP